MTEPAPDTYRGVLHFYSETGTEGGAWAFQDEKFIGLDAPSQFRCTRCGRVWDKDRDEQPPPPSFTYWRDERTEGGKKYSSGYYGSDVYLPDGDLGPGELNQSFTSSSNETARQCAEKGHAEWENMYPHGMWSYEGLHILADGDELTVLDGDKELFSGVVKLPPRQDPYADGAYVAGGGLTAHRKPPVGTKEDWWFEERQATLKTKDNK